MCVAWFLCLLHLWEPVGDQEKHVKIKSAVCLVLIRTQLFVCLNLFVCHNSDQA